MAKTPVRMKVVIYALSPFQQKVMTGLWKDLPGKIQQKVSENWINAVLLLTPVVGTYTSTSGLVGCIFRAVGMRNVIQTSVPKISVIWSNVSISINFHWNSLPPSKLESSVVNAVRVVRPQLSPMSMTVWHSWKTRFPDSTRLLKNLMTQLSHFELRYAMHYKEKEKLAHRY